MWKVDIRVALGWLVGGWVLAVFGYVSMVLVQVLWQAGWPRWACAAVTGLAPLLFSAIASILAIRIYAKPACIYGASAVWLLAASLLSTAAGLYWAILLWKIVERAWIHG